MPPILAAWFVTGGNIPAVIWSVCTVVISVAIYFPFFKLLERQQLAKERHEEQRESESVLNTDSAL
jgi:PTS system cellobiose-specific IIC component